MKHFLRVFVLVIVLMQNSVKCSRITCARFEFPSLNDTALTASENTTVSFAFTVVSDNCSFVDDQPQILQVSRQGPQVEVICQIHLRSGKCINSEQKPTCTCVKDTRLYEFNRTVTRSDNTTWRWSSSSDNVKDATMEFTIFYPASVLSFGIAQQDDLVLSPVNKSSSVDVVCSWEPGNPPVTARLLDRDGVEMEDSIYSSGQIRYRFPAVGCQDAGLIRCEAPGASHNKTATLLVRCPPELQSTGCKPLVAGGHWNTTFQVRTHTDNFLQCRLWQLASASNPDRGNIGLGTTHPATKTSAECVSNLTGTPPDLTLTVRLDNVTEKELGRWRLELANDAGTGHVDFYLVKQGSPCPDNTQAENTHEDGQQETEDGSRPRIAYVSAGAAAVAVLVSITVGAFVIYRMCERRNLIMVNNHERDGAVMIQNNADGGAGHVPDANAYEEIPAYGPLPDPVVNNALQAAAPNQPAGQDPSAEDDVYVPVNEILARKRQAN